MCPTMGAVAPGLAEDGAPVAEAKSVTSLKDFKNSGYIFADKPSISIAVRLRAALALIRGDFLSAGDSPISDPKQQTVDANMNIGLISALVLTILVPTLFDASLSEQTNAYIVTEPAWVGSLYFVTNAVSAWCLALSTLFAILVMLVLGEVPVKNQAQHLIQIAATECRMAFTLTIAGWMLLVVGLILWLVIVSFNLSALDSCDDSCGSFPVAFWATLIAINITSAYVFHYAISLVAKLYQSRAKAFGALSPALSEETTSQKRKIWTANPSCEDIWNHLSNYFDACEQKDVNPLHFREYVHHASGAMEISYIAGLLIDKLFEAKVAQICIAEHTALCERLDEGQLENDSYASPTSTHSARFLLRHLREYPRELSFEYPASTTPLSPGHNALSRPHAKSSIVA